MRGGHGMHIECPTICRASAVETRTVVRRHTRLSHFRWPRLLGGVTGFNHWRDVEFWPRYWWRVLLFNLSHFWKWSLSATTDVLMKDNPITKPPVGSKHLLANLKKRVIPVLTPF